MSPSNLQNSSFILHNLLITESAIEPFVIELFEKLGYQSVYPGDRAGQQNAGARTLRGCALAGAAAVGGGAD